MIIVALIRGSVQEEAAKRDHRKIGRDQELFFFHPLSPGAAFWYPKGAHIYNTLCNFMRNQYRKRGFTEVGCNTAPTFHFFNLVFFCFHEVQTSFFLLYLTNIVKRVESYYK